MSNNKNTNNKQSLILKDNEFITQEDITVYRGEGGTHLKTYTYLFGKCFAATRKHAAVFGEVISYTLQKGSRVFDFDTIKVNRDEEQTVIPMLTLIDPQATRDWMIERGYDATKNTNSRGVEYVVLNEDVIRFAEREYSVDYVPVPTIPGRYVEVITDQDGELYAAGSVDIPVDQIPKIAELQEMRRNELNGMWFDRKNDREQERE